MNSESASNMFKKIKVEVRSNLGICQFYFVFNSPKILSKDESFSLSVQQNAISINSQPLSLPFDVQPQSLCGLVQSGNSLTFRINLEKPVTQIDPVASAFPLFDLPEICPKIDPGRSYMLKCSICDNNILKEAIVISRVILEPMNATDISDIFCHRSKEVFLFEKYYPTNHYHKKQSVYLDIGSFKLPSFDLENLTVLLDADVVHCKHCYSWLGLLFSNFSWCFWNDTVKISPSTDEKSLNTISELILYKVIAETLVECLFSICNIMFVCKVGAHEERRLLLTILDRNLQIWECPNVESSLQKVSYMKVLFEEADHNKWDENSIHKTVLVSKPTFVNTLKLLHQHGNEVSTAPENMAYLPIFRDLK